MEGRSNPAHSKAQGPAFMPATALVLTVTLLMMGITCSGLFNAATVDLGLEHYAEQPLPWLLPHYVPMPLNTLINAGYLMSAVYWCVIILQEKGVSPNDAYIFFMFNCMGFVYSFVQLYRIVMQTLCSAILDQWYTLPFMMLVYMWAQRVLGECSWRRFYVLMCLSLVSYALTLLTSVGFEITLGCHILLAAKGAYSLYREKPSAPALQYFVLGIAACSGFVILKLLDHHLPLLHWIFSYVSGHFLSKICDVLQFHCANGFFFTVVCKLKRLD